jgi:RNA polymerase sigma factor (sigma-70 family)
MSEPDGITNLIERCRKGERRAQELLYRLYYKAMYNVCYRLLNNQFEAEDVMQEAFLSAFLKIEAYRGEVTFGSWLKRIVINKAIDVLRTRKVFFEEVDEKTADMTLQEMDDEMDQQEKRNAVQRIREAIGMLPDGFRVVLSLFLFEGYDHIEIAQILNISESTSRSQLARAKKRLADMLNSKKNGSFGAIH